MNIFFRELKANLKSLLIWSGVLLLFVFLVTAKFSAFYNDLSMLKMVEALPKAMIDAMSMRGLTRPPWTGSLAYCSFTLH